jgi:predicted transcriptional regulator
MGSQSVKAIKSLKDRKEYLYHLLNDVKALELMIENDLFEKGVQRIGAEQELCLIDKKYRPSKKALEVLRDINDPHFTTEIALFNLELNLDPLLLKTDCFSKLENEINILLNKAHKSAKKFDNDKVLLAGILPTLKKKDLVFKNITPLKRYTVLNDVLKNIRGNDFKLRIEGVDELILKHETILFEACNTSFQVHLQIPLDKIVDQYNWAQTISGPVLSVMTNSPMLFGKELWSETRIALFQQSMDIRNQSYLMREQKPRVSFGNGWVKKSIIELIKDDIVRYTPLLSCTKFKEDAVQVLGEGKIPKLNALNVLNGTIYKWNRLCYGTTNGIPHFRIENRYISSGPTVKDEIANAIFWVGIMQGMPDEFKSIYKKTPFKEVKGNFINAARTGINTYFNWFGKGMSARRLAKEKLLPMAYLGLEKSNIDKADIKKYLKIIEDRVDMHQTGSIWLAKSQRKLRKKLTTDIASAALTSSLYKNQIKGKPVHLWKLASGRVAYDIEMSDIKLEKFMTTEIFVVNENDLVDLVIKIMEWKDIHHLPVVNGKNKLVGIITKTNLNEIKTVKKKSLVAKDIMITNIITVSSDISILEAKEIMIINKIGCLPILEGVDLIGILTKRDVEKLEQIPDKND